MFAQNCTRRAEHVEENATVCLGRVELVVFALVILFHCVLLGRALGGFFVVLLSSVWFSDARDEFHVARQTDRVSLLISET